MRPLVVRLGRALSRALGGSPGEHGSEDGPDGAAAARSRPIDVVVPVHDARADAMRCLESVLANGTGDFRLIVVDDASEDPELVAWLYALAARDRRVVLMRNHENLGFVKSANRGMAAPGGHHVLLLNSDTTVPPGFLDRLAAALEHTPRTGVVSPFTNNGTILSLPEFLADNELPEGFDAEQLDALVAGTSPRLRPEIFTAHGFCMLIRRELLDAAGPFDEAYGRGYGEENDLCERAKAAGFEIRLCDDLFVWHRGSASFDRETDPLRTANLELLGRRHPGYHEGVQRFIRANPLADLQDNVRFQIARRTRRRARALLVVLHGDPFADPRTSPVGGTQMHVADLVRALALPRVAIVWPEGRDVAAVEIAGGDPASALRYRFAAPAEPVARAAAVATAATPDRFALRDPERERHFDTVVGLLDVGAAHLHHLSGWPAGIWRALAARGIPFAFTAHDYLCACPSFYALDLTATAPCACLEGDPATVERCLGAFLSLCGQPPVDDALGRVREHRAEHGAMLEAARVAIAPSSAARERIAQAFPALRSRLEVIPHAAPVAALEPAAGRPGGALRAALIGAPSAPWKGADAIVAVMRATRAAAVEWHVFGDAGAFDFPRRAADALGDAAVARLRLHGRYARDEIAGRLRASAADVTLLLSPWVETFSYTLSESWAAGVPAIVLDRGAPAERVRATGGGLVVATVAEAAAALLRLASDPGLLRPLARAAASAARREATPDENAARHRRAYGDMLERLGSAAVDRPWGEADRALFAAHRAALAAAQPAAPDGGAATGSPSR